MKLAVIKLGNRIVPNTIGGISMGEAYTLTKLLKTDYSTVHAYTPISKKDKIIEEDQIEFFNISEEWEKTKTENYDALVVINGQPNFWGGVDNPNEAFNYYIINQFPGKIFYLLPDSQLYIKQIADMIEGRTWESNYNLDDLRVTRTDITYLASAHNIKELKEFFDSKKVLYKDVINFPIYKYPYTDRELQEPNPDPEFDLIYGGTLRNDRKKYFKKYFFGYSDDINVEVFGPFKQDKFAELEPDKTPPTIGKKVKYVDMIPKLHTGMATIVIGDDLFIKLCSITIRAYEGIMAGLIVFIDETYDPDHVIFKNEKLAKFLYVNTQEDVEKRLRYLKENPDFRNRLFKMQLEDHAFNLDTYQRDLLKTME